MKTTNEISIDAIGIDNMVEIWGEYEMVDKFFGDEVVGQEPDVEEILWCDDKYTEVENQIIREYVLGHFTELSEKLIEND